jgi:hypothetical protein
LGPGIVTCVQDSHEFGALATLGSGVKIKSFLGDA